MNHFDVKTNERTRHFFAQLRKGNGGAYLTGKGAVNLIVKVDKEGIWVRTKQGKEPKKISRKMIWKGIRFLFEKRTATRKDLEFCARNSALMGLLRLVFHDIAKIHITVKRCLRISLKGIRYFFSGLDRAPGDRKIVHDFGGKVILLNYHYLRQYLSLDWLEQVVELGFLVLLDSGEFSRYNADKKNENLPAHLRQPIKPILVEEYADFIEKVRHVLVGWMNLDCIGDASLSKRNAEYLRARGLGDGLIEVWHVQSDMEELEKLVEEDHAIIAIGGTVVMQQEEPNRLEPILDAIFARFPDQNFHFLGGSGSLLFKYPWFQADSTSYIGKYGHVLTPYGHLDAPEGWTRDEITAFNVQVMSPLEEIYDGAYPVPLLLRPVVERLTRPRKRIVSKGQLSLFESISF